MDKKKSNSGTIILFVLFILFGCYALAVDYTVAGIILVCVALFFIIRAMWKGHLRLFG